jgi:hypothetical protein
LYSASDSINMIKLRTMGWTRSVVCMGTERVSVGKSEEEKRLSRPRRRWDDNTEMGLKEGVGYIRLAQDRGQWCAVVNMAMNFRVP